MENNDKLIIFTIICAVLIVVLVAMKIKNDENEANIALIKESGKQVENTFKLLEEGSTKLVNQIQTTSVRSEENYTNQQNKLKSKLEDKRIIKVHVSAKDVKTCMRILKLDTINNEVVRCNNGYDTEMRVDQVEKFKLENEVN